MRFINAIGDHVKRGWPLLGAVAGVLAWAAGKYLFPLIPDLSITFSTIEANVGGQSIPPLGSAFLNFFKLGNVSWLGLALSGALLVLLGRMVYDLIPIGKTQFQKLYLVLVYGALVGLGIMSWVGHVPFNVAGLGFLLFYVVVAVLIAGFYKVTKMQVPE